MTADIGSQRPAGHLPSARVTWTLAALLVVALNLRLSIAAVSPLLDQIRTALALTRQGAGLLTTLPVLCFGVVAPAVAYAARRAGNEVVVAAAMVLLVGGILVRSSGGPALLFLGTLLLGAAITAGNVLVPVLVKQHLAEAAGLAMALYTAFLTGGAALAAWGTAALYDAGASWRWSIAAGAVPAAFAAVVFAAWSIARRPRTVAAPPVLPDTRVWRSATAWHLAVFFGCQSFLFYALLAWLPGLLQDRGVSLPLSGLMLSLFSLLGIAGSLAVPPLAVRRRDQRVLAVVVGVGWLTGILGLLVLPGAYLLWTLILGVAQGAGIALAMTLIVLRGRTEHITRDLSGMVQMTGYLLATTGPLLLGALRDGYGSWTGGLLLLLAVGLLLLLSGLGAGRDRMVG